MSQQANFGMIGLGVMGRSLALNIADHGYSVAVWNLEGDATEKFVAANPDKKVVGTKTLEEFVASVEQPRRIMMMIKAGEPVDQMLAKLKPLLAAGDIVIDGGNTWYPETQRREKDYKAAGLRFVGMGVSGGEEGARFGPSMMPGGDIEAWERIKPIFESIAAKTDSGPCVTHCGPDGAGHFVKMVHNGIEYGDMQLIAESYDLLQRTCGMGAAEIADVFGAWNEGPLQSFLIEITARVLKKKDETTGKALVDFVQDKAGQKGTGKWTAQVALDLGISIPTIAAAIDARVMSSFKDERVAASKVIRGNAGDTAAIVGDKKTMVSAVHDALLAAKICSYAQGLHLIQATSDANKWGIQLKEMARIWKGGCIIRAKLLDAIMRAYERAPGGMLKNLLLDKEFEQQVHAAQPGWRRAIATAAQLGIPVPATAASLSYFDSYRTERLPQNLTQAQRDAFGAHTYERIDQLQLGFIHTEWLK
jgi:6-phosphogluconate dehydrogenase